MPSSGLLTPDNFDGDATFVCIPIIVPDKTEFKAAIYGLYAQMTNEWFWKKAGTMTPETAAFLSSRGLGQTKAYGDCMNCEDVADCVETELVTNIDFQNSITNSVNNFGFGNPNKVNALVTTVLDRNPAGALQEEINPEFECNLDVLWGGLRHGIVQRMDDNARTVLENLAAINDVPERLQALLDIIPVLGDVAEAFVVNLTQVIPDLKNLYEAHSSEENLDEIACALFSMVCAECRYPTFEEVYNYYKNLGMSGMPDLAEMTLQILVDYVTGSAVTAAEVAYFTVQTWQMWVWYIQATFNNKSGSKTLLDFATLGEDFANDNWFQLCNACNELYGVFEWDYTKQQYGSGRTGGYASGSTGTWVQGKGWRLDSLSAGASLLTMAQPMDTGWVVKAVSFLTTRPQTEYVRAFQLRVNAGIAGTQLNLSTSSNNPNLACVQGLADLTGFHEFSVRLSNNVAASNQTYLEKVRIVFVQPNSPPAATPTSDQTTCDDF